MSGCTTIGARTTARTTRQVQQGAWLTELCARSSAELTTLFQALGLLGAALLARTCHGWKQAIDQFRAEETSICFTDSDESAPTFFEGEVMARVLPRYVALRTLNLQQLTGSTVGQVACCLAALANKAWPELRSLRTPPLGGTQPPYSSEVSHLVAGALACPQLRELHVSNLGVFMTDAVLHSLLGCQQLRRLVADRSVHNWLERRSLVHALNEVAVGPSCQLLEQLDLHGCNQLEQAMHAVAARCPSLRTLDLYGCSNATAASIAALGRCPELSVLNLERCSHVDDAAIAALVQGCPRLRDVNLMDTSISDAGLATILTAPMLERLEVCHSTWPLNRLSWKAVVAAREQHPHLKGLEWVDDAAKSETPGYLTLKCQDENGEEIYFKCLHMTLLQKLMHAYCNRQGVSMNSVDFLFDDERITEDQRPGQLDMEDGGAAAILHVPPINPHPSLGPDPPWRLADTIDVRAEEQGFLPAAVPAMPAGAQTFEDPLP